MNRELQAHPEQNPEAREISSLFDEPSSEDLFGGNGHDRTAKSLAIAISEFSDIDSAIGLEGDWGSGKSTVLQLAENKLSEASESDFKFRVFTMDLWTTHSDGFRKGFLETFISWAKNKSLLDHEIAERELEYVRGKKKRIKYSSRRDYSGLGLAFLALIPLLPIFYTWLSPFAFNPQISDDISINIPLIVLIIMLAVYMSVILKSFFTYFSGRKEEKSFRQSLSSSLSIFTKDVDTETVTQNITEEDPSTIQFENAFRNIVNKIQSNTKNRVIIVLDNIDRLPINDIPAVWSSIRSLLKRDEATENYPDSIVTVIIPYDRKHVLEAFNSDGKSVQGGFMSEDIIRKTFKRVFYVSPTVPSDWKDFFRNKLHEAIKFNFNDDTVYRLEKILEYHFQNLKVHPTPRQIINHINELAVLWQTWGDVINIHSLSIFTCVRPRLVNDPGLLKSQLVSPRAENLLRHIDWRRDIASLIFNVDREHAYQALLSQDLERLLPGEKSNELKELSKIKGFNSVLVDLVQNEADEWSSEDPVLISNVIDNVICLDLEKHELDVIFSKLMLTLPTLSDMSTDLSLSKHTGLMSLPEQDFNKLERNKIINYLIEWANKNIVNIEEDPLKLGKDWVTFTSSLLQSLSYTERRTILSESSLPANAEIIIGIANTDRNLGVFEKNNLTIKTSDIEEAVKERIGNNEKLLLTVLEPLESLITDTLIKDIQLFYSNKLKQESNIPSKTLESISEILYFSFISEIYEDRDTLINELLNDGTIIWHLKSYYDEKQKHLPHMSWLMLNQLGPTQQNHFSRNVNHPNFGNLAQVFPHIITLQDGRNYSDYQLKELAEITASSRRFTVWLNHAEKSSDVNSIFTKVLNTLLVELNFSALNPSITAKKYSFIRSLLTPTQSESFLNKLSIWSTDITNSFTGAKTLEIPSELLNDIDYYQISGLTGLITVIDDYLKEIDSDQWESHLETASETLDLLIRRKKLSSPFTLIASNFRTPVINHARKLLEGVETDDKFLTEWPLILDCLRLNSLTSITKDMLNIFRNSVIDEAKAIRFILYYKNLISLFPTDKTSEPLFDRLLINLVAADNVSVRQIFIDNSKHLLKIYKSLPSAAKSRFDESIEELKDHTNDQVTNEWAYQLSSLFK